MSPYSRALPAASLAPQGPVQSVQFVGGGRKLANGDDRHYASFVRCSQLERNVMGRNDHNDRKENKEGKNLERVEGIEPSPRAWEATVLPLNYTRLRLYFLPESLRKKNLFFTRAAKRPARPLPGRALGRVSKAGRLAKAPALGLPVGRSCSGVAAWRTGNPVARCGSLRRHVCVPYQGNAPHR